MSTPTVIPTQWATRVCPLPAPVNWLTDVLRAPVRCPESYSALGNALATIRANRSSADLDLAPGPWQQVLGDRLVEAAVWRVWDSLQSSPWGVRFPLPLQSTLGRAVDLAGIAFCYTPSQAGARATGLRLLAMGHGHHAAAPWLPAQDGFFAPLPPPDVLNALRQRLVPGPDGDFELLVPAGTSFSRASAQVLGASAMASSLEAALPPSPASGPRVRV